MLTATTLYNSITRNYTKSLDTVAAEPQVERETAYFEQNIGSVTSASQLVSNTRLYTYVMTAFGLSDMMNAKALITKVLEGGTASNSFAASLNDPRYTALVSAFNFKTDGAATTSSSSTVSTTVANYNEQTLENNTSQENPGAQMALYFRRMASSITSVYSILGNATLLKTVETAYDLPSTLSLESLTAQAQTISQNLDVSQLSNTTYLDKFLNRFTASYDADNPPGSASTTPANALLVTPSDSVGISSSLLLSLANLQLGGS
jgi:hypothetical protein